MLLTDCNNTTFKKQNPYFRNVKTPFLQFKKVVFAIQKSGFCNSKECFLQTKIILKIQLIENKEVTLLVKLNR